MGMFPCLVSSSFRALCCWLRTPSLQSEVDTLEDMCDIILDQKGIKVSISTSQEFEEGKGTFSCSS